MSVRFRCSAFLALTMAFCGLPPQSSAQPTELQRSPGGGWNYLWSPDPDDVAFLQVSEDMQQWLYLPAIVHGTPEEQRWWLDSNAGSLFVRLRLATGFTGDAWDGDFDGDGLSNLFEVTNGLDPFSADTDGDGNGDATGDNDQDGLITGKEDRFRKNPFWMDHPEVKLKARVSNF